MTNQKEINLTENEKAFLSAMESEWTYFCHICVKGLSDKQLTGVASSLVQKGIVKCFKHDGDDSVELTNLVYTLPGFWFSK